jgi:hypothetical protein
VPDRRSVGHAVLDDQPVLKRIGMGKLGRIGLQPAVR